MNEDARTTGRLAKIAKRIATRWVENHNRPRGRLMSSRRSSADLSVADARNTHGGRSLIIGIRYAMSIEWTDVRLIRSFNEKRNSDS